VTAERNQIRAEAEDRADSIKLFLKPNDDARNILTETEDALDDGR
jgi:hypothetical protein